MSADFNTYLVAKGTRDELKAVLGVLKQFESADEIYLDFVKVGKEKEDGWTGLLFDSTSLSDLSSDEETEKFLYSVGTELAVSAGGPYGHFGWLEETGLFEAIADAAPGASIEGTITGFSTGSSQSIWCKTKDGKLHIFYKYILDDSDPYCDYVKGMLPYEEFKIIFKIDGDYEDYYNDSIEELFGEGKLFELGLSEFTAMIPVKKREEAFKNAVERVKKLGIMTREEFEYKEAGIPDSESVYDPVARKYIKQGGIYGTLFDSDCDEDR